MSTFKRIENFDRNAAKVFKEAGLHSDWDIRTLTREDLNELFPGVGNFKRRRSIYEQIHKQKPIDVMIEELKGFIPREYLRAALTENGVLVDYLCLLKDLARQTSEVEGFLNAHIRLLEDIRKAQPDQESKSSVSDPGTSESVQNDDQQQDKQVGNCIMPSNPAGSVSDPGTSESVQNDDQQQDKQGEPFTELSEQEVTVKYKTVVSGKTLDADKQLMDKVMKSKHLDGVRFVESRDDHQVTILFCPISSRIGSDIDAAMSDIKDDKDVILVLMHHQRQPQYSPRTSISTPKNVVMHVNVYYHDTIHGLIKCKENDASITSIQDKLLEISRLTSQNAWEVGAESGGAGSTACSYGGKRDGSGSSRTTSFISGIFSLPHQKPN